MTTTVQGTKNDKNIANNGLGGPLLGKRGTVIDVIVQWTVVGMHSISSGRLYNACIHYVINV